MESIYPDRQSIRLHGFDYGQIGVYFISMVAAHREPIFGTLRNSVVRLTKAGDIVKEEWLRTPIVRPEIDLDEWIIMPDHFQFIVMIRGRTVPDMRTVGAHGSAPEMALCRPPRTIGSMIAQFKSVTTTCINRLRDTPGQPVWQRGYHDRIIRNDVELDKVRRYTEPIPSADDRRKESYN